MKVVPTRVVLLHCGDEQYPQDELKRVSECVEQGVRGLPSAELVCSCTIMKDADADEAAGIVAGQSFDAILVHFVSWHITPKRGAG